MWTKEIIKHLIREFKSHELLYDQTHIHYSNREKRQKSFEEICKSLKDYNDEVTVECVQKKIKSLRGQFSTANKLKAESIENGIDEDDISQPTLWCYDELKFLSDCKSKVLETNNLKRVWVELDQMQRKFRKEIDNPQSSVNYEDEPLTSNASTTRNNKPVSQIRQWKNNKSLSSSDVNKSNVAGRQEFYNEDSTPATKSYSERKIEMNSSNVTVSTNKLYTEQKTKLNLSNDTMPVTKAYSVQNTETNPSSNEKSNMILLLQQQLQIQTQQLQMITSMLKSIERLSEQQMNARRLKTAAIERLTEATERQVASLGNLMLQYQEGECVGEDLTDIIYMD